jgi:putative membrane protein
MTQGRTLVLSVDRDDDIGWKANVESPAVGREACLKAANMLALADPEDSDINAIFSALKIYDELTAKGEDTEIAVVAGNHLHMIDGDRRIATSLEQVVRETGATNCILVTMGRKMNMLSRSSSPGSRYRVSAALLSTRCQISKARIIS